MWRKLTKRRIKYELFHTNYRRLQRSGRPDKQSPARSWEAPTGAHDMYKAGEYMIWADGLTYLCKQDTNFSPEEYLQAREVA